MTPQSEFAARLARLTAAQLRQECKASIAAYKMAPSAERTKAAEGVGACYRECFYRDRYDLWRSAMEEYESEIVMWSKPRKRA